MGTRVIVRYLLTSLRIYHESKFPFAVLRKLVGDVHDKVILVNGIEYHYLLAIGAQGIAGISYLTAHLSVERSALEYELKHSLVLLNDGALLEKLYALDGGVVVAVEHALAAVIFGPIPELIGRSVTRAVLLLLKSCLEAVQIYPESFLCGYHLRKIYRESVGIVEDECVLAGDGLRLGRFGHILVQQLDAPVERSQECQFLLANHRLYQLLLTYELRIGLSHIADQLWDKPAKEWLGESEKGVAVAYRATKDTSYYVSGLHVRRQLAICDGEGDGAHVVGGYAHGHVHLLVHTVFLAGQF